MLNIKNCYVKLFKYLVNVHEAAIVAAQASHGERVIHVALALLNRMPGLLHRRPIMVPFFLSGGIPLDHPSEICPNISCHFLNEIN